jgi:UDP:flavonoid glycosyltransferase YjiC (YdhE family)
MMVDQPYWARRLHGLGVATAPLPFDRLVASSLAERDTEAVTDTAMGARARSLAESVKTESGAAPVIEWVSRQS